jgi:FKBP-type peptidyl-prolyl cis-trans isomerase 2
MKRFLCSLIIFSFIFCSTVRAEDARIRKGSHVKLDYTLTVDGKVMDSTKGQQPIEYVQGEGQIISGLEKQLEGLKAGDHKIIRVPSAEAYGPVNAKSFQEVPRHLFPQNVDLKVGMVIPLQDKQGHTVPTIVKEIKTDTVVLNFNHPLAGKDLVFDVKVASVQ